MIAQLTGTVVYLTGTGVILDVGGVGFQLVCTPATTATLSVGAKATLQTHLAVREDAWSLYGFASAAERAAFVLVQSVTGIGPKLALAIVALLTPAQLRQAILTENLVTLSKVPGVGRKVAQRLVLELKDKALELASDDDGTPGEEAMGQQEQVVQGLLGLGYSLRDADAAWEAVREMIHDDPDVSVSQLMRAALRSLARK